MENKIQKTYLISYDMANGSSENYDSLREAIKKYKTWAHITESLWAIATSLSAVEIRDDLKQYFPENSRFFVIRSGVEAAWTNTMCSTAWLKKNL